MMKLVRSAKCVITYTASLISRLAKPMHAKAKPVRLSRFPRVVEEAGTKGRWGPPN